MKKSLTFVALGMLCACATPRDEAYCNRFNLPKEGAEYANCKVYFARMDRNFQADYSECASKASAVIPEYLYDHPRYGQAESIDRFGYLRSSNIVIEPDYHRNASLDAERRKVVAPCMRSKGWKSPDGWEAGRTGSP